MSLASFLTLRLMNVPDFIIINLSRKRDVCHIGYHKVDIVALNLVNITASFVDDSVWIHFDPKYLSYNLENAEGWIYMVWKGLESGVCVCSW